MKKLISLFLSFTLILTMMTVLCGLNVLATESIIPSTQTLSLREQLSADMKATFEEKKDGYIGIPVVLTTFIRDGISSAKLPILYVIGHCEERIGTDSDYDIINDMLADGHCVTVLDYLGNPEAVGMPLAWSVQTILSMGLDTGKYTLDYKFPVKNAHAIPSGCRLVKDIYYFSIDTMSPYGVNEYIIDTYNRYYAGIKKDDNGEYLKPASTLDECLNHDGKRITTDLVLDIVYPSHPKEGVTVPVFASASGLESFRQSVNGELNPRFINALLQGYAGCLYEHEYIPMSRDDHFGYLDARFTLASYTANKVHSAAIRRIRYLQDELGYDADYVSMFGFSKCSLGPAILSDPNHENKGEAFTLDEYCPAGKSPLECPAEQPWLYYPGTDKRISSNVTVVYAGSGPGLCYYRDFTIVDGCAPVMCSIGDIDDTGGFMNHIDGVRDFLDKKPAAESAFLVVNGVAHTPCYGYDVNKEVRLEDTYWLWIDNHIRAAYSRVSPEVMWTTPRSDIVHDALNEPIEIKFSRAMNPDSIADGVKITRLADGAVIPFTDEVLHGNTTFRLSSPKMVNGSKYRIEITSGCIAADGVPLTVIHTETLSLSGEELLNTTNDAMVTNTDVDSNFGAKTTIAVENDATSGRISKGYFSFERASGFADVTEARLILNQTNTENCQIGVYGLKNTDWDENTITWNNAPANAHDNTFDNDDVYGGQMLNSSACSDNTVVDVTDYVKNQTGTTASFAVNSTSLSGSTVAYDFESADSSNFRTYNTTTKTGEYRWGGGGCTLSFVSTGAHSGNKCVYIDNLDVQGERVKFVNAFGASRQKLTAADIGTAYRAMMYVKPDRDTQMSVGMYATEGYDMYGEKKFALMANQWNRIEYSVIINQTMVDNNTTAVTLRPTPFTNFYLDDFKVEYDMGMAQFASKEAMVESSQVQSAMLVLYTPYKKTVAPVSVSVITSGSNESSPSDNTVAAVCGKSETSISGTKKGYLKLPISSFNSASKKAELKFCTDRFADNTVAVYGIAADDSRFAETFDGNITWNNAFANDANGFSVNTAEVFGGTPIARVNTSSNTQFTVDVTKYVTAMKTAGYEAVTFVFVAENASVVTKQDFEGIDAYHNYLPYHLDGFVQKITTDPTDDTNQVFYFEKSGNESAGVNGYSQNIAIKGMLKGNNIWEESDIGDTYVVSFRQYNEIFSGAATGPFGCIGKGNNSDYNWFDGLDCHYYKNGVEIFRPIPSNEWATIEYRFTVTADLVANHANYTAIVIGSGWNANGLYLDDLTVTKLSDDANILLSDVSNVPGNRLIDFENTNKFTDYVATDFLTGFQQKITTDPKNSANKVFYFEKSGIEGGTTNSYLQSISIPGLFKTNNKWENSDIGSTYKVSFDEYNEVNTTNACGPFGCIGKLGTTDYTYFDGLVRHVYQNGKEIQKPFPCNEWFTMEYTFTVTTDMVQNKSGYTALVIGSGWPACGFYLDNIKVECTLSPSLTTSSKLPQLLLTDNGGMVKAVSSVSAACISADEADVVCPCISSLTVAKAPLCDAVGHEKTYLSFDKKNEHHICEGVLSFHVEHPVAGKTVLVYGFGSDIAESGINWKNAYGNCISGNEMEQIAVYGGEAVTKVVLTDRTDYAVELSELLKSTNTFDYAVLVLAGSNGENEITITDCRLEFSYVPDDITVPTAVMKLPINTEIDRDDEVTLSAYTVYSIDAPVTSVRFFIDDIECGKKVLREGDIYYITVQDLSAGNHNATACFTYANGASITTDAAFFTVTDFVPGDVNGDLLADISDLALLKKYLADPESVLPADVVGADVNKSRNVDITDLAVLKKYLAGIITVDELNA